jgi:ribosomal protein L12E/L44/L45/RPP1/RPP2
LSDNINFNNVIGISASEKCKIDDVKNQKDDKSGQAESEKKPDIEKKESEEDDMGFGLFD